MKYNTFIHTILLVSFGCLAVSCGSDDDNRNDNTPNSAAQYGITSYATCPDDNHPHLIDLGLPSGTKWACCNLKATKPEENGSYFAWGEIEEKNVFGPLNYKYWSDINGNGEYELKEEIDIGSDIAGTSYDVVHMNWGGPWRMPSMEQFTELAKNTTRVWTTQNGVSGNKFVSESGGIIFLPAAGGYLYGNKSADYRGKYGLYLYSTNNSCLFFKKESIWMTFGDYDHYRGLPVRPVCNR